MGQVVGIAAAVAVEEQRVAQVTSGLLRSKNFQTPLSNYRCLLAQFALRSMYGNITLCPADVLFSMLSEDSPSDRIGAA